MSVEGPDKQRLKEYFGLKEVGDSSVDQKLTELKRRKTRRRAMTVLGIIVTAVLFYMSLIVVDFSLTELYKQVPQFTEALGDYFPPATYYLFGLPIPFVDLGQYWAFMMEENLILRIESGGPLGVNIIWGATFVTIAVAFAGTVLGLPGALLFGIMAS